MKTEYIDDSSNSEHVATKDNSVILNNHRQCQHQGKVTIHASRLLCHGDLFR